MNAMPSPMLASLTVPAGAAILAVLGRAAAEPTTTPPARGTREGGAMRVIRIGHSPDADDAFMFYGLTHGKVEIPGVRIEHVLEDIESLNRRAATGELDVTAVSCATYPAIADRYRIMDPGASMGKGYGPIVVARRALDEAALAESAIAVPGLGTTAYLLLRLVLGDPPVIVVPFDRIIEVVLEEQAHAGLLI